MLQIVWEEYGYRSFLASATALTVLLMCGMLNRDMAGPSDAAAYVLETLLCVAVLSILGGFYATFKSSRPRSLLLMCGFAASIVVLYVIASTAGTTGDVSPMILPMMTILGIYCVTVFGICGRRFLNAKRT